MLRIKQFLSTRKIYIIALLFPWVVAIAYCIVNGLWITGEGNIAVGDMMLQIIPIAYEFWDKVHLHESLSFTWHLMDGIEFSSLLGYLASPFTLVMLLIPRDWIADYMQFVMLLKWSLVAVSMTYYFYNTHHNKLKEGKELVSLFLGLSYTLGNGIMSYMLYIQFMDVMICFPILLLLIEKLVSNKNWKLYYIVLAFVIFSNSYIAFQICVFLIIWFFLQLFEENVEEKLKKFIIFASSSILAALTNGLFLISGLRVSTGRFAMDMSNSKEYYSLPILLYPYRFFKQLFMYNYIIGPTDKFPNIYCTLVALVVVLIFPFLKINIKKKIYMSCVMIFLLASFFVGKLNLFWHIFVPPNGVYNRFMYLFIFYMLFLVLYVLGNIEGIKLKEVVVVSILSLGIYFYTFFSIQDYDTLFCFIGSLFVIVIVLLILIFYKRKSINHKAFIIALVITGITELTISSYNTFICYDNDTYYGDGGYIDEACDMLNEADLKLGERVTASVPTTNIGMVAGKNADSGFVSAVNANNHYLHEKLGMAISGNASFSTRGASPLINLLFNIRYGLGESKTLFSDYEVVKEGSSFDLYRIKGLAGLGYMCKDDLTDWDIESGNCFDVQNDFVKKSTGEGDIFTNVNIDMSCDDSNVNKTYENGKTIYEFAGQYGNVYDTKQFDFVVDKDMDLYMYSTRNKQFTYIIAIDDEVIHVDSDVFRTATYHIGNVKKGQKVSVVVAPYMDLHIGESCKMSFCFAEFNNQQYDKVYDKLSANTLDISEEKDDYIKGSIKVDEAGLMMTSVPAMDKFKIKVDNEEREYSTVGGTFIGVPLEAGEHIIEFIYESKVNIGFLLLSVCSVLVFVIISVVDMIKGKDHKKL